MQGFLGLGGTFSADVNLLMQIGMALALLAGAWLARRKRYFAHGCVQSTVVLLNLVLIGRIMLPSFSKQVASQIPSGLNDPYNSVAFAHSVVGGIAALLGLYVILTGMKLLPQALRFSNYKAWMRTTLVLWWAVIALGVSTYFIWYAAPANAQATAAPAKVSVTLKNFAFEPKEVTIAPGTTVEWINQGGRHDVTSDDGSFKSPTLTAGQKFEHKFDTAGSYAYFCSNHGAKGGHDMAGKVTVK
jgi:plastocyanin